MAIENLGPLDWRIPIVTEEGRPTSEFQRRWKLQVDNNNQIGDPGDPTAIASDVAVIGVADTFMRSDSAPEIQKASDTQYGIVQVDGTTITAIDGVISSSGGGGGAAWNLINQTGAPITSGTTWSWSSNVSAVNVIGLSNYNELIVIGRNLTTTPGSYRAIQVSTNNGTTFFNTSGDYIGIADSGFQSNFDSLIIHQSVTGSSRTLIGNIYGLNVPGPKLGIGTGPSDEGRRIFVANNLPVDAIRLVSINPAGVFTAGVLYVYAR